MPNETTGPSATATSSSPTSTNGATATTLNDAPRVSLEETPVELMTDEQLQDFVRLNKERRTNQRLSDENRPVRRPSTKSKEPTVSQQTKNKVLGDLMA